MADYVLTLGNGSILRRITDSGETIWETTGLPLNVQPKLAPGDDSVIYTAVAGWGEDRKVSQYDAATGALIGDATESQVGRINELQWGADYNSDGVGDVWTCSQDGTFLVFDGTTFGKVLPDVPLNTWDIADVNPNDGSGGRSLVFGPDLTGDGVDELYACKGYNNADGKINVWDPTNMTKVATYPIPECREVMGIIVGPDVNGDGREDLWIASSRRNEIQAYDYTDGTSFGKVDLGVDDLRFPLDIDHGPDGTILIATRFATSLDPDATGGEVAGGDLVQYDPATGVTSLIYEHADRIDGVAYIAESGDDSLVASYALDGDVSDGSGNGNDGTIIGEPQFVAGITGQALDFDQTDAVEIPVAGMSAASGTVALWANLGADQSLTDTKYLFGHTSNPAGFSDRIQLYMDGFDTNLSFGLGSAHALAQEITALDTETWYHMAFTWDGANYAVYLDGEEISSGAYEGLATIGATAEFGNNGAPEWREGRDPQGMIGAIDEVAIYNQALSADEVGDLADILLPIPEETPDIPDDESIAIKASGLAIDGDLSDWMDAGAVFKFIGEADDVLRGDWGGPADSSCLWSVMWDDDNIYLAATVWDDVFTPVTAVNANWKSDCMFIFFDADADGVVDNTLSVFPLDGAPAVRYHAGIEEGSVTPAVVMDSRLGDGGRFVEVAIPVASMTNMAPAAGNAFNLQVGIEEGITAPDSGKFLCWNGLEPGNDGNQFPVTFQE